VLASIARSIFDPGAREVLLAAVDFEGALEVLGRHKAGPGPKRQAQSTASLTDL
jgi:hypothetical protein